MTPRNEIISELETNFFVKLKVKTTSDFLSLGENIGEIIPSRRNSSQIDFLTVKNKSLTERSLSSKFGVDAFPLHTDGAYLSNPPKYILLRNPGSSNTCTTVLCVPHLSKKETKEIEKDVWLINGGRGKFYGNLIEFENNYFRYRYDLNCMRPALSINSNSEEIFKASISKAKYFEIQWKNNDCLIFNNWKLLHARSNASKATERVLERMWIKK